MAINFPNSPTINQTVTVGANIWFWNGLAWEVMPSAIESKADMFTNPVFTGTASGTFSGNLTGNVIGNASTATSLINTRAINGVNFNGSANISINTLVNSSYTVTLNSSGNIIAPGNITTSSGAITANQITSTTSVSANSVVATTVTTTNDVTVGGDVNISTKPTLKTHATNRGYVDKKAVAMAVALG